MTVFSVQLGDVCDIPSDLLLLKHAGGFFGADRAVASKLVGAGVCTEQDLRLAAGAYRIIGTRDVIAPRRVMFLGTESISSFSYDQMRRFAQRAVEILVAERIPVRVLTTTIHGVGYGLDGGESILRLVQGFRDGLALVGPLPVEEIRFLSLGERATRMLASVLKTVESDHPAPSLPPSARVSDTRPPAEPSEPARPARAAASEPDLRRQTPEPPPAQASSMPTDPSGKKRAFVAMPYSDDFENVYEHAIYPAVHGRCGCICEKTNDAVFTGDILKQIRSGIREADFVIADLTDSHPNVYLEVGYAWGIGKPVILLIHKGQAPHFDVASHRRIEYSLHSRLMTDLADAIQELLGKGLL